ncbi:MAG TPA: tetratricopeptide repeat protein, partial [Thermodesulfobacteriota bacterium]|nr:tetratricopeptide repeat protein [Thermodesulfobacteriota bacterium]
TNTKIIIWTLGFFLCLSYLFFTVDRQSVWKDSLVLWEDTSKKSFYDAIPHINYGEALRDVGKWDEAIKEFLLVFDPKVEGSSIEKAKAANNIGAAFIDKGKPKNARKWLFKSLKYAPNHVSAYHNIGSTYFLEGNYEKAEQWFLKAIHYNPKEEKTYYHLGVIYFMKAKDGGYPSDFITAEKYLKEALRIHPYYAIAHLVLAQVYTELDNKLDAKEHAQIALDNGLNKNLVKEAEEILKVSN